MTTRGATFSPFAQPATAVSPRPKGMQEQRGVELSGAGRQSNIQEIAVIDSRPLIETTLPEGVPEYTLGWQLLAWAAMFLRQPDGSNAGSPFIFTREQVRLILWWYAVDEKGRFLFTSGVIRRMKGWGKDPFAAALCLMELCGPTVFWKFDNGRPVGKPHPAPWIQVAAVSRDQTKNTFTLFPGMISSRLKEAYGLEINKEIIHKRGGGRIEAVTSSPNSLEGGRSHFVLMNETQFWLENNNGHDMKDAIAGNTAKGRAEAPFRRLAICNAHRPGEDSVAEQDYEFFEKLLAEPNRIAKFFYDAREASPDTDINNLESLRLGIEQARGDSVWLDVQRLMEEIDDPRTPNSEARRKYLNQIVASEDAWLSPQQWSSVERTWLKLEKGDEITLGFDGSTGEDWTALTACRVKDGAIFLLAAWNPATCPGGKIPKNLVDLEVDRAFDSYNVVCFRADVREFESYVDKWAAKYKSVLKIKACPGNWVAYDMRSKSKREFPLDCERFESAVINEELAHDGNRVLRMHILNSRRRPNNDGHIGIGKESRFSPQKIDAAVTAVLAFGARQEYLMNRNGGSGEVGIF